MRRGQNEDVPFTRMSRNKPSAISTPKRQPGGGQPDPRLALAGAAGGGEGVRWQSGCMG